ncbi:phosphoadenosine phosphosulfate reductase [Roseovarius sp. SYSU LYC5161]|uniref:phosphoadenosine phosphosulfate reductase n=1 Tax=Roseovarius halophilus (ex Wu et al. 2025) TaxID=3376060 RepID=UPI00399BBD1A
MQDTPALTELPLRGLDWDAWLDRIGDAVDDVGYVERLGTDHAAILAEDKPVLLVTFETHERLPGDARPVGWQLAEALGWSHLCVVSHGDTWFRAGRVYGFFDRLIDDGFFEDFEQVIFYGAGPCGYAAAAFSVAAPGARVLALQPHATLDPRMAEWDDRFLHMRRTAFDDRYGYAPDMLDAAERAFVLYDPESRLDAMHAALFARPNVTRFRIRHLGATPEADLLRMQVLYRMLARLSAGKLSGLGLAELYRARRSDIPYLKTLLARVEQRGSPYLTAKLAQYVMRWRAGPRFRRALRQAYETAEAHGLPMPSREFS